MPAPRSRNILPLLLLLVALLGGVTHAATPDQRFDQALKAYAKGDFQTAATTWQALVDEGHGSPELVYNLGNAYYRLGDAGRAVLGWERALWMDPRQRDARANLELIRPRLADQLEAPMRLPLWNWVDGVLAALPTALLAWTCLVASLASGAVGAWRMLRADRRLPAVGRLLLLMFLLPALSAVALLLLQDWRFGSQPRAVVLDAKIEVRAAPSPGAVAQFDLHAGTVVDILRTGDGGWLEVALPDARSGWTLATGVEAVRLPVAP